MLLLNDCVGKLPGDIAYTPLLPSLFPVKGPFTTGTSNVLFVAPYPVLEFTDTTYVVFSKMYNGVASVASCHPYDVSEVNAAVASSVPLLVQICPV